MMPETFYFIVPKNKITTRMINSSTARGIITNLPEFKDAYIIESQHEMCQCLMDYPMYTQDSLSELLSASEETKSDWWQKLLSLFSVIS